MNSNNLEKYKYNGARSLAFLHEKQLRSFLIVWREAKRLNLTLPDTEDPDYKSLNALLHHVFRVARGYMVWMCNKLELPDPEIKPAPEAAKIENEADEYLISLLEKWRTPLSELTEEVFHTPTFKSNWNVDYCIDAMLEHAVMHPIRHEFQLKNTQTSFWFKKKQFRKPD